MAVVNYFFHITRNEESDTYLVTIVIAALIPQAITEANMLEVIGEE